MNNWKKVRLSELADITMGQSPKSDFYNSNGDGLPFLQGNRTFGDKYPTFDTWTTFVTKEAEVGDVIMSVRAPVGDINITPLKMCLGRGVCGLRHKQGAQEFLYYLLRANKENLINRENGTVFGSINKTDISNLEVQVPSLREQIQIGLTLKAIDDKIENNKKINHHLEEMGTTIWQEKFSDKIPNGTLGDIAIVSSGKRPPVKTTVQTDEEKIPILGASSVMGYTNQALYHQKILVTGRVGTHGIIQRYQRSCWPSDNTLVLQSNSYEFVYQILKNIDFTVMNRGSTQPLITQTDLKKSNIYIPTTNELSDFEIIVGTLMKQHEQNNIENDILSTLRDTLLPKLLFGKISVNQATK